MRNLIALISLLGITGNIIANDSKPVPQVKACSSSEYQQFDFWLGHWSVTTNGKPAGENHIKKVYSGCALAENWSSSSSEFQGGSYNIYDQSRKLWHQTWVDSSGSLLQLEGGLVDGSMVLQGNTIDKGGEPVQQRISWTPNSDGSVRQHWQVRKQNASWKTIFDGLYVRKQ